MRGMEVDLNDRERMHLVSPSALPRPHFLRIAISKLLEVDPYLMWDVI